MAKGRNLLVVYKNSNMDKKVDLLIDHYSEFLGVIDGYVEGLVYKIQTDKDIKRRSEMGELGVRVQGGGIKSDPTATKAISNIVTREAIEECNFNDEAFEDVDDLDIIINTSYSLRQMRREFELLSKEFRILGGDSKAMERYLKKEVTLPELSTEWGMSYEAAKQRVKRNRNALKNQVIDCMEGKLIDLGGIA